MKRITVRLMLAGSLLLSAASSATADVVAATFDTPTINVNNGRQTNGWRFTANSQIVVTELGFYDDLANGLVEDHLVGLYAIDGTLLTSALVTDADPLSGFFHYQSIANITLTAGTDYVLAAVSGDEDYTHSVTGLATPPEITYVEGRFQGTGGINELVFPGNPAPGVNGYFGPNFRFKPIPAPGAALLGTIGLGLVSSWRRRARP